MARSTVERGLFALPSLYSARNRRCDQRLDEPPLSPPFTDSFRKRFQREKRGEDEQTDRRRVELEIPIATEFVNSSSSSSPLLPRRKVKIIRDCLRVQRLPPLALLFFPSFPLFSFPPFVRFSFSSDPSSSMRPISYFSAVRARAPLPSSPFGVNLIL